MQIWKNSDIFIDLVNMSNLQCYLIFLKPSSIMTFMTLGRNLTLINELIICKTFHTSREKLSVYFTWQMLS